MFQDGLPQRKNQSHLLKYIFSSELKMNENYVLCTVLKIVYFFIKYLKLYVQDPKEIVSFVQ